MTPQQKLERLIAIAKEANELMVSMDLNDAMRVLRLDANSSGSSLLMADARDFKTLYPKHHVEDIDGLKQFIITEVDGVIISTIERNFQS